jgi:hypothetical protein
VVVSPLNILVITAAIHTLHFSTGVADSRPRIATLVNTSFLLKGMLNNSELLSLIERLVSLSEMFSLCFTPEKHAVLLREVLLSVVELAVPETK